MTITAVKTLAASEWKPEDDGPAFLLKPLTGLEMTYVSDYVTFDENRNALFPARACEEILKHGLVGWSDFKTVEGEEIEFDKLDQSKNISVLPFTLIRDMADQLLGRSRLGVEEAKKS